MVDGNAENRKLDALLDILKEQNSEEDTDGSSLSDCSSDDESRLVYAGEDEELGNSTHLATKSIPQATEITTDITNLTNLLDHISFEEFDIISECPDAKLKELMVLNRAKHVHLNALLSQYKKLLYECEKALACYTNNDKCTTRKSNYASVQKVGYPYFSRDYLKAYHNDDVSRKKANGEINYLYSNARRTNMNKATYRNIISYVNFNHYLSIMDTETVDDNAMLDRFSVVQQSQNIREKFNSWKQIASDFNPPNLGEDAHIDWQSIAETYCKHYITGVALRALWNYYLHPSINKEPFTPEEDDRIVKFMDANPSPDWVQLASELGTNRSEHQLCSHYRQKLDQASNMNIFIGDGGIQDATICNDRKLALSVTRQNRYHEDMEKCVHGPFSLHEDLQILSLVKRHGLDFHRMSMLMPERTALQIKRRYDQCLSIEGKRYGFWTQEEDEQILEHVRVRGKRDWKALSLQMLRNVHQLRLRHTRLEKFLAENTDCSVADMRRPIKKGATVDELYLRRVKHFAERIPEMTDADVVLHRPFATIADDLLVQFFTPAAKLKETRVMRQITEPHLRGCAKTVKFVLGVFKAQLNIPDDFRTVPGLDRVDVEVLDLLRNDENTKQVDSYCVIEPSYSNVLIPPNVSSIQVLRYLLLSYFKDTESALILPKLPFTNATIDKFVDRFKTFLKWPSLLSTFHPPPALTESTDAEETIKERRKVGRPKKDRTKIVKMMSVRSQRNPSEWKIVKSVEDLHQNLKAAEAKVLTKAPASKPNFIIKICRDENTEEIASNTVSRNTLPGMKKVVDKELIKKLNMLRKNVVKSAQETPETLPVKNKTDTSEKVENSGIKRRSTQIANRTEKKQKA